FLRRRLATTTSPAVAPAPGEGRGVPGKFQAGAIRIVEPEAPMPRFPELPEWGPNPYSPDRRLVLANIENAALVVIAEEECGDRAILTMLRQAVVAVEERLGIGPKR